MARRHEMTYEENVESLRIPADAHTFEGFLRWLGSDEFPESGRIDFLAGEIEAEMSPEDLQTHGVLKVEIGAKLHSLVRDRRLGQVFMDSTRVTERSAGLSAEPDVVVVLWDSLATGRARFIQDPAGPAIEGAPDLIVEVISRRTESKDRNRLPAVYAAAGIPELWLIDARGHDLDFELFTLSGGGGYVAVAPDAGGWLRSGRLPFWFRLRREPGALPATWLYTLEHRDA